MEESGPNYSSESFLPFPTDNDHQKHTYSGKKNKNAAEKANDRHLNYISPNIPWKNKENYSCGVIGLHEEINDFYEKMHSTEQENEIRLKVVENVTRTVHFLWPQAKVEVFGSFRTGLYLPTSDIDIVVIGHWKCLPLSTLSDALQRIGISKEDITIIANATVPIIRLIHTPSRVKVDISFNLKNGVDAAKLVKQLIKDYPPLSKLVLVLKQFLVQRGLNEVYNGGMSSYCLTLLIVSLLQGCHKPPAQPSCNLGTLLLEFFEHYGVNFNYERVSIHFENGGNYQPKYRTSSILNVEDPTKKGNNIAKGTFMMQQLQIAFQNAFLVLHKAVTDSAASKQPLNSYLKLVVNVDDSIWEERRWIQENYSSIMNQLSSSIEILENSGNEQESQNSRVQIQKRKKMR